MQNNGSLYLHAFITKSGSSPNPHQAGYRKRDVIGKTRCKFIFDENHKKKMTTIGPD